MTGTENKNFHAQHQEPIVNKWKNNPKINATILNVMIFWCKKVTYSNINNGVNDQGPIFTFFTISSFILKNMSIESLIFAIYDIVNSKLEKVKKLG